MNAKDPPHLQRLRASDYRRVRWKNDGGWTTEIALHEDAAGLLWRISIAEIERDGPFSHFPGIDRVLMLLDGSGIELDIDTLPAQRLSRRFAQLAFAGEAAVGCRLLAGPTRDFNVMTRRGAIRAEVHARPLVDAMLLHGGPGDTWLIHVHAGAAAVQRGDARLDATAGDTLRVDFGQDARERAILTGAGEVVLVRLAPHEDMAASTTLDIAPP
jgi:environmental stress-induced protein Ves